MMCSSQGGRVRSSCRACKREIRIPSSRWSPGRGNADRRTWYMTSNFGSSTQRCSGFSRNQGVCSFMFHGGSISLDP
ncbi:Uncharacterised protein [Mycobacteroides abscessus subsp. abscessus]|nr:Uncharacterised protein [Mycobacteroides abscessus subsp. abscessus]